MKKSLVVILSILMILMLLLTAACGSGQSKPAAPAKDTAEKTIELKLGHTLNDAHILNLSSVKFAELVKAKSNGRIKITIFGSGQLGNDIELIESVMGGEVDLCVSGVPFYSAFTPVLDAYLLPFLIDNYDIERKVFNAPIHQEMLDTLKKLNIVGLSLFEGGLVHIGNTQREIKKPADMKGLKLRTGTSSLAVDSLKAQGSAPVPMVLPEVYSGLQTNVIDGVQTNLVTIYGQKFHEVIKYLTIHGQYSFPAVLAMSGKAFSQLSEADQKIFLEAAKEASDFSLAEIERLDKESYQAIEKAGVKIYSLTNEEKQVFIDVTKDIYEQYMEKDPLIKKFVDTVRGMK